MQSFLDEIIDLSLPLKTAIRTLNLVGIPPPHAILSHSPLIHLVLLVIENITSSGNSLVDTGRRGKKKLTIYIKKSILLSEVYMWSKREKERSISKWINQAEAGLVAIWNITSFLPFLQTF